MPLSMTGFGRAVFKAGDEDFIIEVRSLNHRYLDIKTRLPEPFSSLDTEIRGIIKDRISRGSVVVSIEPSAKARGTRLDMVAARRYLEAARRIKKDLKVNGSVDLGLIMSQKGIFTETGPARKKKELLAGLREGLDRALGALVRWRKKEGRNLVRDIKKRLRAIGASIRKIEKALPRVRKAQRERLASRIEGLCEDALNEPAVLVEAAVFAERTDITEEIVRLKSHLQAFGSYLGGAGTESLGKRLDFLAQEVLRELNTIASKAQDAFISQTIVDMKCELEKIREQVQNLE